MTATKISWKPHTLCYIHCRTGCATNSSNFSISTDNFRIFFKPQLLESWIYEDFNSLLDVAAYSMTEERLIFSPKLPQELKNLKRNRKKPTCFDFHTSEAPDSLFLIASNWKTCYNDYENSIISCSDCFYSSLTTVWQQQVHTGPNFP